MFKNKFHWRVVAIVAFLGLIFGVFLDLSIIFTGGYILSIKVINILIEIPTKTVQFFLPGTASLIAFLVLIPVFYFFIGAITGIIFCKIKKNLKK